MNKSGGCTYGNPTCEWCGGWRQPDSVPIDEWMAAFKKCDKCEAKDKRIAALEAALLDMLEADSIEASHKAIKQAEALLPGGVNDGL